MNMREEILSRVIEVQKMPTSIQRVLPLLNNENADLDEISSIIELDPGITANLLRLANSTYFGAIRNISNVREALVRLGSSKVTQILITTGISSTVGKEVKGYDLEPGKLLERSITVAIATEQLARELKMQIPDHAFTSGLLADIGKTVLGTFVEVDSVPILDLAQDKNLTFEQAEEEVLGINHAEVGAILLEFWGLPENIVNVARWRLSPDRSNTPDPVLDLVHVADILAKNAGIGLGIDGMNYSPSMDVVDRLGLTTEILDNAVVATMTHLEELKDILA